MEFVYADGRSEHELELRMGRPDASVADLAEALGAPGAALAIDGRAVTPDLALTESGLVVGSTVAVADQADGAANSEQGQRNPEPSGVLLRVVGGLSAGAQIPLLVGTTVIGRDPRAGIRFDLPDVSREHCRIEVSAAGSVSVRDLGSRNGVDVDGVRVAGSEAVGVPPEALLGIGGAVVVQILPAGRLGPALPVDPRREARPGGRLPFNRAPRAVPSPPRAPVRLPSAPAQAHKAPFSVAALIGPLVMAGAMIAVTGNVTYALLAGLTPLMFIGNFVEERTHGKRSLRRGMREFAAALEQVRATLTAYAATETASRRAALPDPAEIAHRAGAPGLRLWERRPASADFQQVTVGFGDLPWEPPAEGEQGRGGQGHGEQVADLLAEFTTLRQVPIPAAVGRGEVLGLVGDRQAALAVARSVLCQAVVGAGPADVTVAVFLDDERAADWDWAKWLPHTLDRRGGTRRLLAVGPEQVDVLARSLLAGPPADRDAGTAAASGTAAGPTLLAIVDGAALLEGRPCPLRDLLAGRGGPAGGVVLTDRLPALCTATATVHPDGRARLDRHTVAEAVPDFLATGVSEDEARHVARALARFEDPELRADGAGLPDRLTLLPLLELPEIAGPALARRWSLGTATLKAGAVLGVTEQDVFAVDLDDDGPHGLIAGTTGSGKSELLRTLIISLAAGNDPEHLTFALVDYKGGGALDECARLPHAVGLVTDLDEQLGERALRCLEAELRHREHLFRAAGLSHITDYQRLRDTEQPDLEPMPRLVVVIDEFATLVKALPTFVDSLVSVAQRGRSLGMHLIMATQRPAGSVGDAIKNNVKLRIALRLESSSDSDDVIDNPAAAGIGSRQWGRGYFRLSAREVVPVQTALSTGVTPDAAARAAVTVAPFLLTPRAESTSAADGPTDLQRLVAASHEAVALRGFAAPRRPWPEPLPEVVNVVELEGLTARGWQSSRTGLAASALADDPDTQSQYPVGWDLESGNILIYGAVGSGTSTALAAIALAEARRFAPDRLHVFVLDFGAGDLAPLRELPHVGAYIAAAERERQARLIRMLRAELDARKAAGATVASGTSSQDSDSADWLVLLDNMAAFLADFDKDVEGNALIEDLLRLYADGPAVGIRLAIAADRAGAVPGAWAALTQQKLLLRLADPGEYGYFDVPRTAVPGHTPGRAVVAATRQVIQIAWPGESVAEGLAEAVAQTGALWPEHSRTAPAVGLLPDRVPVSALAVPAVTTGDPWWLPVGIGDSDLGAVGLELYEHEHALVAGPPRSGRSQTLCAVAEAVRHASPAPAPRVLALAVRRSPLRDSPAVDELFTSVPELCESLAGHADRPVLLLIDDADAVDDPRDALETHLTGDPYLHVLAAGRADALRRAYGHWTNKLRESRTGVLLTPDHDLDGDLLGVALPRAGRMAPLPGRGYLIAGGGMQGVQVAMA